MLGRGKPYARSNYLGVNRIVFERKLQYVINALTPRVIPCLRKLISVSWRTKWQRQPDAEQFSRITCIGPTAHPYWKEKEGPIRIHVLTNECSDSQHFLKARIRSSAIIQSHQGWHPSDDRNTHGLFIIGVYCRIFLGESAQLLNQGGRLSICSLNISPGLRCRMDKLDSWIILDRWRVENGESDGGCRLVAAVALALFLSARAWDPSCSTCEAEGLIFSDGKLCRAILCAFVCATINICATFKYVDEGTRWDK